MGVPAFFKWLTLRYPQVVSDAIEEINSDYDINDYISKKYNVNKAMPEIDNFYLEVILDQEIPEDVKRDIKLNQLLNILCR